MLKVICHVLCSLCGMLSGLGGAGCSEQNHQVITVLCGPHRQQIRLRGSMICSWKSTPLKSKSIHSERLPKDKVPCIIKKMPVFLCECVCPWSLSFSVYYLYLCSPLHVCFYLLLAVLKSRQACVIFQNSALLHEQAATLLSGTVGFISSGLNAFKNVECNCNTLTSVSCQHDSVWIKIQMASGIRAFHIHSMLMFVHGS